MKQTPITNSVFQDGKERGFGLGIDQRKSTITLLQAAEVMRVLNNLGIYGQIYVNQEGMGAGFVEPDQNDERELIYVLFYGGNYHELAEVAITLDKSPKVAAATRILSLLGLYENSIYNIPAVSRGIEETVAKLFL